MFLLSIPVVILISLNSCSSQKLSEAQLRSICQAPFCRCVSLSKISIKAACRLTNLTDLRSLIKRPEMVTELAIVSSELGIIQEGLFQNFTNLVNLDLNMTRLETWEGDLQQQLPSLMVLNITGNINFVIPDDFIKHSRLRHIIGVYLSKNCPSCSLTKDLPNTKILSSGRGFLVSKDCVVMEYLLIQSYQKYPQNDFIPFCVTTNDQCLQEVGALTKTDQCLKIRKLFSYMMLPLGILSLVSNIFVTVVIIMTRRLRKSPSLMLVVNICVSGILFSVNSLIAASIQHMPSGLKNQGDELCRFLAFVGVTAVVSTSLFSLIVTVERYLAIIFSMKPDIRMNRRSVLLSSTVAWALSFGAGSWLAVIQSSITGPSEIQACAFSILNDYISPSIVWYIMALLVLSYFPVVPLYIHIFIVAKKSGQRVGLKRDLSLSKRIFLVVGTNLILLYIPVFAAFAWPLTGFYVDNPIPDNIPKETVQLLTACSYIFYILNSLANPHFYVFRNRSFMNAAKCIWNTHCSKKNQQTLDKRKVSSRAAKSSL